MSSESIDRSNDQSNLDDDYLAIDLRIRLLESVFAGALSSSEVFVSRVKSETTTKNSIALRIERIHNQLTTILNTKPNDAIRRFVHSYDLNEPLLHLPNPLSSNKPSPNPSLSTTEKIGLVFEAESEIIELERDLREIELLDTRGFVGAGKLANGDWSVEELTTSVLDPLEECDKAIKEIEDQAATIMSRYDSYVNALSEIFISWDSILSTVEDDILQLQSALRPREL